MLKKILVPLDGSPLAEGSLPVAARLARANGGSLALLQVVPTLPELVSFIAPVFMPSTLGVDLQSAEGYLAGIQQEFSGDDTSQPQLAVSADVRSGAAPEAIIEAASGDVDAIVLCTHGHTGLLERVWGSVTERVARGASVPVLILRDQVAPALLGSEQPQRSVRVLAPVDGSASAGAALLSAWEVATALSAPAPAEMHTLGLIHPAAHAHAAQSAFKDKASAEAAVGALVERLRQAHPDAQMTTATALTDDVSAALIAEAQMPTSQYDLIALGLPATQDTQASTDVERLLAGTTAALLVVRA